MIGAKQDLQSRLNRAKQDVEYLTKKVKEYDQDCLKEVKPGQMLWATVTRWSEAIEWKMQDTFRAQFVADDKGYLWAIDKNAPFCVGKASFDHLSNVEIR